MRRLEPFSSRWLIWSTAVAIFLHLLTLLPAQADSPSSINIPVALAPVQRDTPVELVALTLDVDISEDAGHTVISGYSTFKVHNTDRLNDLQVPVGFPAWAGDAYSFDPSLLGSVAVSVEGKKTSLTPSRAESKVGSTIRAVDWYTFTLSLAGDEKKTVRIDFTQDLGDGALPRFTYGLVTATGWKGSIGSARLTLNFGQNTTPEQLVAYDPANATFDGASLTWLFLTHEPPANPTLTFIRPSLWDELVNRRRAVQQNGNDANARASLGSLLRQLAQADSSRRESYQTQAIAELEMATRLDPSQRAARQGLAALYESRAGPAAGPRQTAYVQLAVAQWEALSSGDAAARKQLAEDYFYLGLDAQTRRAFADALAYFDKAAALAPGGAGPLFTSERAAAQRRALYVAWARALAESDDFAGASARARVALGDAFMASFQSPPFYLAHTTVAMSANTRSMAFRFIPFALSPDELTKALNDVASALRKAGADVTVAPGSSDRTLTVAIPFENVSDLNAKLNALAKNIPIQAEWSVLHAVLSPDELVWDSSGASLLTSARYQERINLSDACGILDGQSQAIDRGLKPLENAAANDAEAQLKRALLTQAKSGWQRARAQGDVTYSTGRDSTSVEACAARTVAFSSTPWRVEMIAGIAVGFWVVGMIVLFVVWSTRVRRNRAAQRRARAR
jgi:hypothetical protein